MLRCAAKPFGNFENIQFVLQLGTRDLNAHYSNDNNMAFSYCLADVVRVIAML